MHRAKICERLGLRPIINVSGTMTALGASIGLDSVAKAMAETLPEFVEVDDLQRKASATIARLTGSEAGLGTASAAAGMTIPIAGAMTRADLARVEQLPDATDTENEVAILRGHMVYYD